MAGEDDEQLMEMTAMEATGGKGHCLMGIGSPGRGSSPGGSIDRRQWWQMWKTTINLWDNGQLRNRTKNGGRGLQHRNTAINWEEE